MSNLDESPDANSTPDTNSSPDTCLDLLLAQAREAEQAKALLRAAGLGKADSSLLDLARISLTLIVRLGIAPLTPRRLAAIRQGVMSHVERRLVGAMLHLTVMPDATGALVPIDRLTATEADCYRQAFAEETRALSEIEAEMGATKRGESDGAIVVEIQ